MKKMMLGLAIIAVLLSGCQTLDTALAKTGSVLDATGDILSGDLRGLGAARQATLTEIWNDWQQNEGMHSALRCPVSLPVLPKQTRLAFRTRLRSFSVTLPTANAAGKA
jgi:hypothetical protein